MTALVRAKRERWIVHGVTALMHMASVLCVAPTHLLCVWGRVRVRFVFQVCVSVRLHGIGHWTGTLIGLGNLQRGNKGAARHQLGCGRGAVARVRSSGDKPRDSNFHIFQRGDRSGLRLAPIPCSFLTRDRVKIKAPPAHHSQWLLGRLTSS